MELKPAASRTSHAFGERAYKGIKTSKKGAFGNPKALLRNLVSRGGDRTSDPLIKSQLLYQLS